MGTWSSAIPSGLFVSPLVLNVALGATSTNLSAVMYNTTIVRLPKYE
jgi:hypothetical protein